jgi:hypothetical protein
LRQRLLQPQVHVPATTNKLRAWPLESHKHSCRECLKKNSKIPAVLLRLSRIMFL